MAKGKKYRIIVPKAGAADEFGATSKLYPVDEIIEPFINQFQNRFAIHKSDEIFNICVLLFKELL